MSSSNQFDIEKLTHYLEKHVEDFKGPITLEKFPGGQSNPTFKVNAGSGVYVLRSQPQGKLLKSAHAVDREYKVLHALNNTQVPVANVFHLCTDTGIIGSMFYLMEYCEGRIFWEAALKDLNKSERSDIYDAMNKALVAIHSVDIDACGLTDFGKPGNFFQRQISRFSKQYRLSELREIPAMDQLMEWLEHNQPEHDDKVSLVHGDFRLDNMMFHPDKAQIIAVLDWELSTLGHPFADLAYQCMQLRMPQNMGSINGLQGLNRSRLGIPTEEQYVEKYCQRMGLKQIDHWTFYLAFSFFRLAAIVQGVAKRATEGNASNKNASEIGGFVEPLAQMAMDIIENKA